MPTPEKTEKPLKKSFMERVVFETTIQYRPLNESIRFDLCNDLSVGGLYLRTAFPFSINETIALSFSIPNQDQEISISCKARVAWTNFDVNRRKPQYPSGVGLQFLDLSCEDSTILSSFIDTYDKNKKMNVLCAWCGKCLGMRKGPFGSTSHGICNECRKELERNSTSS